MEAPLEEALQRLGLDAQDFLQQLAAGTHEAVPASPLAPDAIEPLRAFADIFKEHNITRIDFLSLDVEGHEVQALSSVDLSKVHIDIIISENPRVAELLLRNGYRLQSSAHDNILLRNHFQPAITRHGGKVTDRTSSGFENSCD